MARGNSKGTSQPGRIGEHRCGRGSERDAPSLSTGGRALAVLTCEARPWRLPCRRYGARQNDPDAFASSGAEKTDGREGATEPAGGPRFAACQLGCRNRALYAELASVDSPSFRASRGGTENPGQRTSPQYRL